MIILPIAFTLFIYSSFSKQSQMEKAQQTTLHSLESVDTAIQLSLENATYQRNLFTGVPRLMMSFKKILLKDTMSYSDVVIYESIKTLTSKSLSSNLNIHSLYLSLDDTDRFYCSDRGIQTLENFPDKDWRGLYTSHDPDEDVWTCRRTYYEYNRPVELISVYLRLINARGVIVVNLYPERLQNMVDKIQFNGNEAVFLLNSEQEQLLTNAAAGSYGNGFKEKLEAYIDLDNMESMVPQRVQIDGEKYYATVTSDSNYGYRILSVVKERDYYTFFSYFNTTFLLQAVSAVVIALVISLFVTLKNINQFYYLFGVLQDAEQGVFHKQKRPRFMLDEFDLIINNVIKTFVRNENLQKELSEKQYHQTKTELTALQLQINPHFLFNSLQLLDNQAYRITNSYTELNITIQKLSAILKYTLSSPQEPVTLREEIQQVQSYADINYKRYQNMFILYYDYSDNILDCHVFRLLLQPLIENSLYHGIRPLNHQRTGLIKIKIYDRGDNLHFRIIDNGVGAEKSEIQRLRMTLNHSDMKSNHIGLSNTNARLLLYFGGRSRLHIQSKYGKGTSVSFKIPKIVDKTDFHLF